MQPQEFVDDLGSTELLTIEESARLLRVSPATVWRLVKSGHLPAIRIGKKAVRIRRADLAYIIQPASEREVVEGKTRQHISGPAEPMTSASQEERQHAAHRLLRRRAEIGPIDLSVTDLINEGLDHA